MDPDTPHARSGYGPIFKSSPLLEALGGFYSRGRGADLAIGLRVDARHANSRGRLHGGVIATLADTAIGYLLAYRDDPPTRLVTVSLSVDFVAAAKVGDWVDVTLDEASHTGRLVFASGRLQVEGRVLALARAIFSKVADER